jgi:hypothetical protein
MDLGAIKTIFSFGSLLALTPPKIEKSTIIMSQKLYIIAMFLLHSTCSAIILILSRSYYSRSALMTTVLRILHQAVLFAYSVYTVMVSGLMKRRQWFLLVKNLERVECEVNNEKSLYIIFFVSNAIYIVMIVYTSYVWTSAMGLGFVMMYSAELLPVYSQFFITVSTCGILKMIQSRYKYQKVLLNRHFTQAPKQLSHMILLNVKRSVLALKDAVDLFNDIFGWNNLLSIFFIALRSLFYLDSVIKRENNVETRVPESYWQVVGRLFFMLTFWVSLEDLVTLVSLLYLGSNLRCDFVVRRHKGRFRRVAFVLLRDARMRCRLHC